MKILLAMGQFYERCKTMLLLHDKGMQVVALAGDGTQTFAKIRQLRDKIDLLIVDDSITAPTDSNELIQLGYLIYNLPVLIVSRHPTGEETFRWHYRGREKSLTADAVKMRIQRMLKKEKSAKGAHA
ncbi:MAG TPA: hypothetical protein PKW95_11885 [bacterium]|nr:hypothetical protein [bacterium]